MTWLHRLRRRRTLLAEADRLDAEARDLRRTLPNVVASAYGWRAGALALLAVAAVEVARPDLRPVVKVLTEGRDEERAKELERAAQRKREEAKGLG